MRKTILAMALPLMLLAGCKVQVGKDGDGKEDASVSIGADGNVAVAAADGAKGVSVKMPGFEGRVAIPGMEIGSDNMDIHGIKPYPGTKFSSINVTDAKGPGNGQVDMRFTAPATPDKVAAHFAAEAKAHDFTGIAVASKDGGATMTATNDEGDPMTVTLTPAAGGSAGHIQIRDSGEK